MGKDIPLVHVKRQFASMREEIDAAVGRVLDSAKFVLGDESAAFEREFAHAFGMKHAVGVANGTDALHLALRALGIGNGDRVAVPALTFFATAEAVIHAGAQPVVVDVDAATSTMSPEAFADVAGDVAAVIPVHLYGHPADMDPIVRIARSRNACIVEDAAQAHGSRYRGRFAGSIGDAGTFSFYPTKNMGGAGDGGLVATGDAAVAERVRLLRHHGQTQKDVHEEVGFNSRLDDLQAAILRVRLKHLDAMTKARRQVAAWYHDALAGLPVELPREAEWADHVWHLYVIRVENRDAVASALRERGVGCAVHYGIPLNRQPAYTRLGISGPATPHAEAIAARQLAIPMDPGMTAGDVDAVASALREALA